MSKRQKFLISKVTQKYQTTIPQAVREVLGIHQGDCIAFEIEGKQVMLKKVLPMDWDYLNAVSETLTEWLSHEDEKAYHDFF